MIKLDSFVGQACRSRTAFEFTPKEGHKLDLEKTAKKLSEKGVFVELESPYLLMLKTHGKNVSLFKSGKMVVKGTTEKKEALKIAESLINKLN